MLYAIQNRFFSRSETFLTTAIYLVLAFCFFLLQKHGLWYVMWGFFAKFSHVLFDIWVIDWVWKMQCST